MLDETIQITATEKKKRPPASLKTRMAKMAVTRSMWDNEHDIPEANHDFVLMRLFKDGLHIFKDAKEAVEAVKEAFKFEEDRERREKEETAKQLMLDPEMKVILEGMVSTGTGKVGEALKGKTTAK